MKNFIIKEIPGFRLRVTQKECDSPAGLYSIEFIQEYLNKQKEVVDTSIYNFFLTQEEISSLCENLLA
jgi:hypothetical protein